MKSKNTVLRILLSIIIYFVTTFVARMIVDSSIIIPSTLCACPSFLGTVDPGMTGCVYKFIANKYCLFGIGTSPSYSTYGPTLAWVEVIVIYLLLPALVIFLFNKLVFRKRN